MKISVTLLQDKNSKGGQSSLLQEMLSMHLILNCGSSSHSNSQIRDNNPKGSHRPHRAPNFSKPATGRGWQLFTLQLLLCCHYPSVKQTAEPYFIQGKAPLLQHRDSYRGTIGLRVSPCLPVNCKPTNYYSSMGSHNVIGL